MEVGNESRNGSEVHERISRIGERPQELHGSYPEGHFPWGENADNGFWIQSRGDHIHVRAQVCGGALGVTPGRFKTLYRVWWQSKPADQPHSPFGVGKECCERLLMANAMAIAYRAVRYVIQTEQGVVGWSQKNIATTCKLFDCIPVRSEISRR